MESAVLLLGGPYRADSGVKSGDTLAAVGGREISGVCGRGICGMEKSPTRWGRVGCLYAFVREEIFVSVRARDRGLDILVSVRYREGAVSIRNNPLRDSRESLRDKGYNGIEMTEAPSPSSSTFGNVG